MSLTAETEGVKDKITASVSAVEASVNANARSVSARVSARLVATAQTSHYVPLRLDNFEETDGFLENGIAYVDDGNESYRLPLKKIKEMNTKIVNVDDVEDADLKRLTVGDYICIKK